MKTVCLSDVARIIMGQSPPSSTYNNVRDGLPFFQGKADFGDIYPTARIYCNSPQRIAEPGDVLISVRAPVGPTNMTKEISCLGRGLAAIRSSNQLDNWYLLYFLRYYEPRLVMASDGSTFDAIGRDDLENIPLILPPLPEQQRIAAILEKADRLRRLRRCALEIWETFLQSVFLEIFGDPKMNLKNFEVRRFGEVFDSHLGKMLDAKQQTGKYKRLYLRNVNVQWNRLDLSDVAEMDFTAEERRKYLLKNGDVLICEGGEVGRAAIWRNELPECYFQKALHRVRVNPKLATPEFLVFLMFILAKQGGLLDVTSEVTFAHLTGVKLKTINFPLPPLHLQEKFSHITNCFQVILLQQNEALRQAEHLFRTLLHRAFNDQL